MEIILRPSVCIGPDVGPLHLGRGMASVNCTEISLCNVILVYIEFTITEIWHELLGHIAI